MITLVRPLRCASLLVAVTAACAADSGPEIGAGDPPLGDDRAGDEPPYAGDLVKAVLPAGALQADVVEFTGDAALLDAVTRHNSVYLHDLASGAWYFRSGNYLLGIEAFTRYEQKLDRRVDFTAGDEVAPAQARVVGHSPRGEAWEIPQLTHGGQWPAAINSVWVIGTGDARFGMGGAPQEIPIGTEVFGSMQTYGGALSTPYLVRDGSSDDDSVRVRAAVAVRRDTLLGGHSAGATVARRIALDIGVDHVWLYGTPNYSRGSGAYEVTETDDGHVMVAQVINNHDDPVTNVLTNPLSLTTLAWGTSGCHSYNQWNYQKTAPVNAVCP
jgi:hypothetical protein